MSSNKVFRIRVRGDVTIEVPHALLLAIRGEPDSEPQADPYDGWPEGTAEFGQKVRRLRERHRLTRKQLAKIVGIADSTVRNIEYAWFVCRPDIRQAIIQTFAKLDERAQPSHKQK